MRAKTLQIPLIFSLIALLLPVAALCSDDDGGGDYVSISINMNGDAYITITNQGGSIKIIYNGRDILREFATKKQFSDLSKKISRLKSDFRKLVDALDLTFDDLYGKVYFLANVIGILEDNSTVALQLKSGNVTLTDFIEQLFSIAERQEMMIGDLSLRIEAVREENRREINELWNRVVENLSVLAQKLEETQLEVQLLRSELNATNQRIDSLIDALDSTFDDLYGRVYFLARVTGVYGDGNSTVTLMLRSGNVSLAWFIERLMNLTENQGIKISELSLKIESEINEVNVRIDELEDRIDLLSGQTNARISELSSSFNEAIDTIEERINEVNNQASERINGLNESISSLSNRVDSLTSEIEELRSQFSERLHKLSVISTATWLINFIIIVVGVSASILIARRKPKQP